MRGIYIIVEGQTEEEFVNNSIKQHLNSNGIYDVRAITLKTRKSQRVYGDVRYSKYKLNVRNLLSEQPDILVTSLIDFYALRKDFPSYDECRSTQNPVDIISCIEKSILNDIDNFRFIPYIQLHEFEGLLFTDIKGFDVIPEVANDNHIRTNLLELISIFPNPELINEGITTAPSKRLHAIIPSYEKTFHGPLIALENTFDLILEKCPRFKNWIDTLIDRMHVS